MCMLHRFPRFVVDLYRFFFVGYCWSLLGFGVAFIGSYTDLEGPVSSNCQRLINRGLKNYQYYSEPQHPGLNI